MTTGGRPALFRSPHCSHRNHTARSTGAASTGRLGPGTVDPQVNEGAGGPPEATLARQLVSLWLELERRGAVINRVPLDSHHDLLVAKVDHEARRIRALGERS